MKPDMEMLAGRATDALEGLALLLEGQMYGHCIDACKTAALVRVTLEAVRVAMPQPDFGPPHAHNDDD